MPDKKYDRVLRFTVTQEEYNKIVDCAQNYGMTISDLCRYAFSNEIQSFKWSDYEEIATNE